MAHYRNWISRAVKHPGAFKAKAMAAGMSTRAFALMQRNNPGKTGRQARLALSLMSMRKKS